MSITASRQGTAAAIKVFLFLGDYSWQGLDFHLHSQNTSRLEGRNWLAWFLYFHRFSQTYMTPQLPLKDFPTCLVEVSFTTFMDTSPNIASCLGLSG